MHTLRAKALWLVLTGAMLPVLSGGEVSFVNFETAPIHPVALSPDGETLAVCNLPDGAVEFFDLSVGLPVPAHLRVGVDPVAVRFRTATELWVVNHISSTINIVDVPGRRIVATLDTLTGPADVVFAGSPVRAFVSCAKDDTVQVFDPLTRMAITNVAILGNRPKAMAVSPDGTKVYVAIFESGNASTIAGFLPPRAVGPGPNPDDLPGPTGSLVSHPTGPYGGADPPPNVGTNLVPPLYRDPYVEAEYPDFYSFYLPDSIIVKKNAAGRWMDDNNGDWTQFISGTNSTMTGRPPGWDMPDRDLAIIDTASFEVTYATGLMNICMSLAVNPASGNIAVIGTDATNERRFEPQLRGTFLRVNLAMVNPVTLARTVIDLNAHLDYSTSSVPTPVRDLSLGDPRGVVWNSAGSRGYVTGMGSRNLIVVDGNGHRVQSQPIELGEGPTGLALDEERNRLYVLNRFSASLSVLDTASLTVLTNLSFFDPTPPGIKIGRKHLYDTRRNSGLGHVACGSCHLDARFDRLAWDLGDPTTVTRGPRIGSFGSEYVHPLKGPLVTQTLQDIIGSEPLHWRGDRGNLQTFDLTFTNLLGVAALPTTNDMAEFETFLSTIDFPPNRLRNFDNALSTNLPLTGLYGRNPTNGFPDATPLPNGNAVRGADLFANLGDPNVTCANCHNTSSGFGIISDELRNARARIGVLKGAQLRNVGDKLGFDLSGPNSRAGFGLRFDGRVDTFTRFLVTLFDQTFKTNQDIADLTAFVLSSFPSDNHASLGRQLTLSTSGPNSLATAMISLAMPTNHLELVARGVKDGLKRGWFYDYIAARFQSDRNDESIATVELFALPSAGQELTLTLVAAGTGRRLAVDRDDDATFDRTEVELGFDPADPLSNSGNLPPRLPVAPDLAVHPGMAISVPFTATDPNSPTQTLHYTLIRDTPAGATLNPTNGIFNWTPAPEQSDRTYRIGVEVTDDGTPALYDRALMEVNVVTLRAIDVTFAPALDIVHVVFQAVPGQRYQLLMKKRLDDSTWTESQIRAATTPLEALFHSGYSGSPQRFYRIVRLE